MTPKCPKTAKTPKNALKKSCKSCHNSLPLTSFYKHKSRGHYYYSAICKQCKKEGKQYNALSSAPGRCIECNKIKPAIDFPRRKRLRLGRLRTCKECYKRQREEYAARHEAWVNANPATRGPFPTKPRPKGIRYKTS